MLYFTYFSDAKRRGKKSDKKPRKVASEPKPPPPPQIEKLVLPPWIGLTPKDVPQHVVMRHAEFKELLTDIKDTDELMTLIKWQVEAADADKAAGTAVHKAAAVKGEAGAGAAAAPAGITPSDGTSRRLALVVTEKEEFRL